MTQLPQSIIRLFQNGYPTVSSRRFIGADREPFFPEPCGNGLGFLPDVPASFPFRTLPLATVYFAPPAAGEELRQKFDQFFAVRRTMAGFRRRDGVGVGTHKRVLHEGGKGWGFGIQRVVTDPC
jgi:hypothetical protein